MIYFICICLGFYLIFDSLFLAAKSDKETRNCMIAKYVGAALSGAYLVWLSAKDLLYWFVLNNTNHVFISSDAMEILLLFGLTIGFFMWPDTFWRALGYLQIKRPKAHLWVILHFKIHSRRSKW